MTLGATDHRALGGTFCIKAEEKHSKQLHQQDNNIFEHVVYPSSS